MSLFIHEEIAFAAAPAVGFPLAEPISFDWSDDGKSIAVLSRKAPTVLDQLALFGAARAAEVLGQETFDVSLWSPFEGRHRTINQIEQASYGAMGSVAFGASNQMVSVLLAESMGADSFRVFRISDGKAVYVVRSIEGKGLYHGELHPGLPLVLAIIENELPRITSLATGKSIEIPALPQGYDLTSHQADETGFGLYASRRAHRGTPNALPSMVYLAPSADQWMEIQPDLSKSIRLPGYPPGFVRANNEGKLALRAEELIDFASTLGHTLKKFPPLTEPSYGLKLPKEFVATETGREGFISPALNGFAYIHNGALLVSPLAQIDPNLVVKMAVGAERTRLVIQSKQVALALIMYLGDNDRLPGSDGWMDAVYPYVNDRAILLNFSFVGAGLNPNTVDNPASTEIGFVPGPGGRAVAYADGSVRWIPDPK